MGIYSDNLERLAKSLDEQHRVNVELKTKLALFRLAHETAYTVHRMNRGVPVLQFVMMIVEKIGANEVSTELVLDLLQELCHVSGHSWISDELHARDEGSYGYRKNGIYEIAYECYEYFSEYIEVWDG